MEILIKIWRLSLSIKFDASKEAEEDKYKAIYLLAEKSRILKKKEANRTADELEILNQVINKM